MWKIDRSFFKSITSNSESSVDFKALQNYTLPLVVSWFAHTLVRLEIILDLMDAVVIPRESAWEQEKYVVKHMSAFIGRFSLLFSVGHFSHAPSAAAFFDHDQVKTISIFTKFSPVTQITWQGHMTFTQSFWRITRQIFYSETWKSSGMQIMKNYANNAHALFQKLFKIMINPFSHSCIKLQHIY